MKLAQIVVKVISDTTVAGVETALNTFLRASGERTFISIQWMSREYDTAPYTAMILYME